MIKKLWGSRKPRGLLTDALEETCGMLVREEGMFRVACDALLLGRQPEVDIIQEDEDINVSERMVRRMVFEHLALNPEQDLPASLALIGIVHDVERVGDYTKSLLELTQWRSKASGEDKYPGMCGEIREMIEPMFQMALKAIRESDADLAREVMRRHREVKDRTDVFVETVMEDPDVGRGTVVCSIASRFFRRISAHLSNIASSVANPFDRLGGDES